MLSTSSCEQPNSAFPAIISMPKPSVDLASYLKPRPPTPTFASLNDIIMEYEPTTEIILNDPSTYSSPSPSHSSPSKRVSLDIYASRPQTLSNKTFHPTSNSEVPHRSIPEPLPIMPESQALASVAAINNIDTSMIPTPSVPLSTPEPAAANDVAAIDELIAMVEDDDTLKTLHVHSAQHARLELLICEHQKRLRQPKVIISDPKAASVILDLELLHHFNNRRYELQTKAHKQRDKLANALPKLRAALKAKAI
jgi:hypothetical protein